VRPARTETGFFGAMVDTAGYSGSSLCNGGAPTVPLRRATKPPLLPVSIDCTSKQINAPRTPSFVSLLSRVSMFERCVMDPYCAARTVQEYMPRVSKVNRT